MNQTISKISLKCTPKCCTDYTKASLLPMLASFRIHCVVSIQVRSRIKGFKPMVKLLLGDDLQNPKLNEEMA